MGYCKHRHGDRLVQQGNYEVVCPDDGKFIKRSDLAGIIEPGMVLEMSISFRKNEAFRDGREKCPRCSHINSNATVTGGWIDWKVASSFIRKLIINLIKCSRQCAGQFHVTEAGLPHEGNNTSIDDEVDDGQDDGEPSTKIDGEHSDVVVDGNIISPDLYVTRFIWGVIDTLIMRTEVIRARSDVQEMIMVYNIAAVSMSSF
jgi:hypothetical protein